MTKQKILKIKVGEVFLDGKAMPVFVTAFQKTSKKGGVYYEYRNQIFVQEITQKEEVKTEKIEA